MTLYDEQKAALERVEELAERCEAASRHERFINIGSFHSCSFLPLGPL